MEGTQVITGNLSVDLLIVYIPALLAIVMGILGVLRGSRREAVVSGSIVLASLIILVWSTFWAQDLNSMFSNLSAADARNILGYVTMGVLVLLVGYMLGSALVSRTPISPLSRLGGFLIGAANGLAIGGFFIRHQYDTALLAGNNELATAISNSNIALYLRIWSNWFPLVVAIAAGIVALIGPFRRAQTTVATPDTRTDWGPSAAPAVGAAPMAAPGPAAYTTGYGQGFTGQYPQQQPQYGQQYGQPYAQPQPPTQQYAAYPQYGQQPAPPPVAPPPSASPMYSSTSYAPTPPTNPRLDDAPPTTIMPGSDQARNTPPGGQETHYFGTTRSATPADTGSQSRPPDWAGYGSEPSWLTSTPPSSGSSAAPQPAPVDSSLVARSEAPTMSQPIIAPSPASSPDDAGASAGSQPDTDSSSSSFVNCSRCGTLVPADATFCTECGNRLKTA
jgi:hypothetical protein